MEIQEQYKETLSQPLTSIRTLSSSNSSSTTVIQGSATQSNSGNVIKEFSGGESDSLRPNKKGIKLVYSKCKSIQWEIFDNSRSPDSYNLGSLEKRMGVIVRRAMYGGPWSREERIPHKRARIEGSQTGNDDIHSVTKVGISIHVRKGNMASMTYLMKMGGIKIQEKMSVSKESL